MNKPRWESTVPPHVRSEVSRGLAHYLMDQVRWSRDIAGHGLRTGGLIAHIKSELEEIRAQPNDLMEWVDVIILAMDGYWRAGGHPGELFRLMMQKQHTNFGRDYGPPPPSEDMPVHARDHKDYHGNEHMLEFRSTVLVRPAPQGNPPHEHYFMHDVGRRRYVCECGHTVSEDELLNGAP